MIVGINKPFPVMVSLWHCHTHINPMGSHGMSGEPQTSPEAPNAEPSPVAALSTAGTAGSGAALFKAAMKR